MLKEYFELFGVLLGIYGIFRVIIWWELGEASLPSPRSEKVDFEPRVIDASHLAERVKDVRLSHNENAGGRPISTKPLRVAERRQEIAKLAFFQKPADTVPEPLEQEHRLLFITL